MVEAESAFSLDLEPIAGLAVLVRGGTATFAGADIIGIGMHTRFPEVRQQEMMRCLRIYHGARRDRCVRAARARFPPRKLIAPAPDLRL